MAKRLYPPGPKGTFPGGVLGHMQKRRLDFLLETARTYGDIAHFRIGPRHVYLLNHPDYIHYVLVEAPEKFNKSPALKSNTRKSIGQGLLTSEGDFHKRQRRLAQPAFHHKRIAAYGDLMVDYTRRMLDTWQPGEQRNIAHEMTNLTMQIVARTLFDADVSDDMDSIGRAISIGIETVGQRVTQPFYLPDWIPTPKNRERQQAARVLETTIMDIINRRREAGEDRGDLLSMLLLAVDDEDGPTGTSFGRGMTDKQVRDEVMTLFIAGHETTANTLAWTLYLLAQHPEVEAKLTAELDAVLDGRLPAMQDLPALRYTDMVIQESMRLYPPAWIISREVMEDITIGDYDIARGSIVIMSQYVMHHHPRYFDEPARFLPERFAEGWDERIPRYAYFPFGGGPRICIGNSFAMMEAALVLATIMQRVHLAIVPGQQIEPEPLVTLRPRHGIEMAIMSRAKVGETQRAASLPEHNLAVP
jgi:cytochrome P450